ncbi:unnamed protein product [Effrenium voratum]|nr:unnamed protein product [Effrenium voratum]
MLAALIFSLPNLDWNHPTDHCEFFSGKMSVTLGELQENRKCAAYDIGYDPVFMDIASSKGYAHALYQTLNLLPGSFMTLAPVCSSFVYMSRGSTGRTRAAPEGRPGKATDFGNLMAARCVILIWLASCKGVAWVLEQPRGSILEHLKVMQGLFGKLRVYKKHIRMGDFGAASEKGTWLYSSHKFIDDIYKHKPYTVPLEKKKAVQLVDHYTDRRGQRRIKGNAQLKGSQAYPLPFGKALAKLRTAHAVEVRSDAQALLRRKVIKKRKGVQFSSYWLKAAKLEPVLEYLTSA